MSYVRLLEIRTVSCGCTVGRYLEVRTNREVTYVEEKGARCEAHGHRRNHLMPNERLAAPAPTYLTAHAS